jgi:predicted nuclease of predicted toxin-antitoxin system
MADSGLMRLLADENFPRPIVEALRERGHDVLWARTDCPGAKDRILIERAEAEDRLVLMLDKDFWQLALQRPGALKRSGVVLFRVHPAVSGNLELLVLVMLRAGQQWMGHVSVITPDGIEMFSIRGQRL